MDADETQIRRNDSSPALSPYPRGEDEGEGLRPFLRL